MFSSQEKREGKTSYPLFQLISVTTETIVNINTGIQAGGNLTIAAQGDINDSFKFISDVKASGKNDELAARLEELHGKVSELIKLLPEKAQESAARSLKVITEEAKKKEPDKAWYQFSANGLLEAAKTVASLTEPVTKAVKAVSALLLGTDV